jgi:hypothetical protein
MFTAADYWEKISREMHGWNTLEEISKAAHMSAAGAHWTLRYASRHGLAEVAIEKTATAAARHHLTRILYRKRESSPSIPVGAAQ